MNILDLQNKLKNLSQEQLVQEMQAPTGDVPQFLVLSEITRRQKMRTAFEGQQGADQTTVAEDAIASAGVPSDFAGQMAGAMAPQTDMQGNTGATPQAPMMPEEQPQVQGMAGGGIVALRDGGPVQSPRLVVRDGRQFAEMPDGSLIPLSALGFNMDAAGEAPSGAVNPSYVEDQPDRFPEGSPALPQTGLTVPQTGGRPPVDPAHVQQATDDFFNTIGGVITPPLKALDQSPAGQYRTPSLTSLLPQSMQDRIAGADVAGMPMDFGAAGDGFPVDSISGAPATAPTVDPMLAFQENFGQDDASNIATIGRQPGLGERIFGEDALRTAGIKTAAERRAEEVAAQSMPTTEGPVAAADPQAVAEAETLTDTQTDPTPTPPGPQGPIGPSGGGIAGLAGAAGAAPTDFEQELLSMLAAREKRAEQDKWLSLAQFGLQLMSSKESTLGGAIGAAGAPALETLRSGRESYDEDRLGLLGQIEQSRMGREKMDLERQALAARMASGGGGRAPEMPDPMAFGLSTDENRQMEVFMKMAEASNPATQLAGQQGVDELLRRLQIRSNMPTGGASSFDVRG